MLDIISLLLVVLHSRIHDTLLMKLTTMSVYCFPKNVKGAVKVSGGECEALKDPSDT